MVSLCDVKQSIPVRVHPANMHWGDRLRTERNAAQLTQLDLANVCAITKAAVSQWERGGGIRPDNLFALADRLRVDAKWLATGKGSRTPSVTVSDLQERELLTTFRALPEPLKGLVMSTARNCAAIDATPVDAAHVLPV